MSDNEAFLTAINAAPDENLLRLAYADWLDEQGRPGSEFLRIDCEIADLAPNEFEQREQLRAKHRDEGVVDSGQPGILDSYYRRRAQLVAKLRRATRGLDDDWIAAVSRVPIEEINFRVRQIQSWLRRRVTVAEMLTRMAKWDMADLDEPPESRWNLWAWVRGLFRRSPAANPALHRWRERTSA